MPVVGFHQARRHRQTPANRLRRELSWPRPGGIAISLAGAALIFCGAQALSPDPPSPAAAAGQSASSTTAAPTQEPTPAPASPASPREGSAEVGSSAPATLSASAVSASPIPPASPAAAPLIAGAAADSPIQRLFAAGNEAPTDPGLRETSNPGSPLVLVNKQSPLVPPDYEPPDLVLSQVLSGSNEPVLLRAEAALATEQMFAAAAGQGVNITVKSSYRSYDTQVSVYNAYVADKGVTAADSTSARPGFSEHQTGLALDIGDADAGTACDFATCFEDSAAAKWVAAHGADYGFLVRYVPGQEAVTGYLAEPWHLRYVGVAVSRDMQLRGIESYEEYLGLPAAPGYK